MTSPINFKKICPCEKECLLKEIISSSGISERSVVQIFLLETLRIYWKDNSGLPMDRNEAWLKWAFDGYAEAFSEAYREDWKSLEDLRAKILKKKEKQMSKYVIEEKIRKTSSAECNFVKFVKREDLGRFNSKEEANVIAEENLIDWRVVPS